MIKSFVTIKIILFTFITIFSFNSIVGQSKIKVISPNGGEKLQIGTRQGIAWISNDIEKVNIKYSTDNGNNWQTIFSAIDSELGHASWKIPDLNNSNVKIKIENVDKSISDISDNYFSTIKGYSIKGAIQNIAIVDETTVIMPLGNSITYDTRSNDTRVSGDRAGYRAPLYNKLISAGIDFTFTGSEYSGGSFLPAGYDKSAGFPGISDAQLATLMKTGRRVQPHHDIDDQITVGPYLNTYPADIILLHIGSNGNNEIGGTSPNDVEEILDEIDRYEDATGSEITVIVSRIIDRVPNQSYVNEFNNNVEAMVLDRVYNPVNDAYPDNLIVVDMEDDASLDYVIDSMGTIGNGITGDMNDALHPNDKGYAKMAQVWFDALVEILPGKPEFTQHPKDQSTVLEKSATFSATATGNDPLTYQWKKNGDDIGGATNSTLTLSNILAEDDSALITCVVSNYNGTKTSNPALLIVAGEGERVDYGLEVIYNFTELSGDVVEDNSEKMPLANLDIDNSSNAEWIPFGIELNSSSMISSSSTPTKIYENCLLNNEISLEAWIYPKDNVQTGPARILTFSVDGTNRNFTLGQDNDKYIVRLRTTSTSDNGTPAIITSAGKAKSELSHILYSRDSLGNAKIYVNGELSGTGNVGGDFSNWNSDYLFALGNEFSSTDTERFWLGQFYLSSIYSRALSEDEILHNYQVGFEGINDLLEAPTNLTSEVLEDTLVALTWEDNEQNELGYIIERKANDNDSVYIVLATVNTNITQYTDSKEKYVTSYLYRVKTFNENFTSGYSNTIQVDNIVSDVNTDLIVNNFELFQNYPNPFNPTTTISFNLPKSAFVKLNIYNALGQKVKTLISSKLLAGKHDYNFNVSNLPTGIYVYSVNVLEPDGNKYINSKKMILLK